MANGDLVSAGNPGGDAVTKPQEEARRETRIEAEPSIRALVAKTVAEIFGPRKYEPPTLTPISSEEFQRLRLDSLEVRTKDLEYVVWGFLGFILVIWLFGRR